MDYQNKILTNRAGAAPRQEHKLKGELKMKKTYELVNEQGCLMDKVEETSFRKARAYFAALYSGTFKLIDTSENGEIKTVRL